MAGQFAVYSLNVATLFTKSSSKLFAHNSWREKNELASASFPHHKIVQDLACLPDGEGQDNGVIGEAESSNPIGDKIERIQNVNNRSDYQD